MGKKKVLYLDPDKRKWTMKDLGLTWDMLGRQAADSKEIEGTFFVHSGKIYNMAELSSVCNVCFDPLHYNDEHDSAFCPACDEWREPSCSDPNCEYCLARPVKPSQCN